MRVRRTRTGSRNYWRALTTLLSHPALPSQTDMAKELGTDQGFVSHAIAGDLVRITGRVMRLRRYASSKRKAVGALSSIASGSMTAAASATMSAPTARPSTARPSTAPGDAAIELCRLYVVEGYDANVLADQVRILRRAQNAARA